MGNQTFQQATWQHEENPFHPPHSNQTPGHHHLSTHLLNFYAHQDHGGQMINYSEEKAKNHCLHFQALSWRVI